MPLTAFSSLFMNVVQLSIFANRLDAVCEEMGATLQRSAFSPNIRDRLDYSCAVFDAGGELCAQAAHIPVHLGSMAFAMRDIVSQIDWQPGDMVILNDPFKGGTHLPDISVIAPLVQDGEVYGFVVNRAHHADIGSDKPGSMPVSTSLFDEGQVIEPTRLVVAGELDQQVLQQITGRLRQPQRAHGDFIAQVAANRTGLDRLTELVAGLDRQQWSEALAALNAYAGRLAKSAYQAIPDGAYRFEDVLDDDGQGNLDIAIRLTLKVSGGRITADFTGTDLQVAGNVNCPLSVTAAAVFYVFRCLLPAHAPACAGCFDAIDIVAAPGCLLNANFPAAVAAGNVETSTRVVDVVLGALAQAIPDSIPAASYGSMNNIAMCSVEDAWDYYETVGGGTGASPAGAGLDAVQAHMTNTLNTPIESLEMHYPLRVERYQLRRGSGGEGLYRGGDGILRSYRFLKPAQFTLLTERRRHAPWGLAEGDAASAGINSLNEAPLPGKVSMQAEAGDVLTIETPGGGGFGEPGSD